MTFRLSARSEGRLVGVHPDLVAVVRRAIQITPVDFGVLEGVRSLERQRDLVKRGASQTMNSRHLTGHAVDLYAWVPNERTGRHEVSWETRHYESIAKAMFEAASHEWIKTPDQTYIYVTGTKLRWGGHWKTFKDLGHFELPRSAYP